MKKIIAISVVFALVAGAAFAEMSISGSVETVWTILNGDSTKVDKDDSPVAFASGGDGSGIANAAIQISGSDDEGIYGGLFKITFNGEKAGYSVNPKATTIEFNRAFAWWKPIPQLELFLGRDGDGKFESSGLNRWAFHQMPRGISKEDWDGGHYFLGHWDDFGLAATIRAVEGLTINLAMNIPQTEAQLADDAYKNLYAQAAYEFANIGKLTVTYDNAGNEGWWQSNNGAIGGVFNSGSLVEGLDFAVGMSYNIQNEAESIENPIRIGLAVYYNIADFGVKTRFAMRPMIDVADNADAWFYLKGDIMPFYNLGFATIYCNFRLVTNDPNNEDLKMGWHINPYIRKSIGGSDMRFGFMIEDEDGNGETTWKLPVSMVVSF